MIVTRHLLAAGLSGKSVVHGRVASHRPESVFPPDPLAPMRVCMPRSIKSRTQSLSSGGPQVSCIMCVLHPAPMGAECGHGSPGPQLNPSSHPRLLPILCGGSFVRRIAALTLLVAEIPWREPLQGQRGGPQHIFPGISLIHSLWPCKSLSRRRRSLGKSFSADHL